MKVKLVHILTEIEDEREKSSIASLSPLSNLGINYIQQINKRYVGDGWKETKAITQKEYTNHGAGHYGAYQSFKKALTENFSEELDALILCECDCVLDVSHKDFVEYLKKGIEFCNEFSIDYLSFGSRFVNGFLQSPVTELHSGFDDFYITNKIILAHCVVLPKKSRHCVLESLDKFSWDSPDIWFNEIFWANGKSRFGIIKEKIASQHQGISLIDNCWKEKQ